MTPTRPERRRIERNSKKPLYDQLAEIQGRLDIMSAAKGKDFNTKEFIDLMEKEYPMVVIKSFVEHLEKFLDEQNNP